MRDGGWRAGRGGSRGPEAAEGLRARDGAGWGSCRRVGAQGQLRPGLSRRAAGTGIRLARLGRQRAPQEGQAGAGQPGGGCGAHVRDSGLVGVRGPTGSGPGPAPTAVRARFVYGRRLLCSLAGVQVSRPGRARLRECVHVCVRVARELVCLHPWERACP